MSKQDLINSLTTSTNTEKSLWIEELEEGLDTLHKYEYEGTYPTTIRELLHLLLRLWTTGVDVSGGVLKFEEKVTVEDRCHVIIETIPVIEIREYITATDNLRVPARPDILREYITALDDVQIVRPDYLAAITGEVLQLIDSVRLPIREIEFEESAVGASDNCVILTPAVLRATPQETIGCSDNCEIKWIPNPTEDTNNLPFLQWKIPV